MPISFVRNRFDGYPMFRMNSFVVRYWIAGGMLKRQLATVVSKTWKTGVVMLNPQLYAVGVVDPAGNATDLTPPFHQYEMWQVCNKPSVRYQECACRNYYDPEVGGPWSLREKERDADIHHPHCQFERHAMGAWKHNYKSAVHRQKEGFNPQKRPDEWMKTAKTLREGGTL